MLPISWPRFFTLWVSMAIAMSANGIFRELALRKITSSTIADILSAIIGMVLIAFITWAGFRPMTTPPPRTLLAASVLLVLLTVTFETVLGIAVDRKSMSELVDHYAIWRGQLWPLVLAFLAYSPFLWAKWQPAIR